jgi:hypothetical protein
MFTEKDKNAQEESKQSTSFQPAAEKEVVRQVYVNKETIRQV